MKNKSTLQFGALYIRVSTDRQEELSPDAQKRLLLDYAKSHDIMISPEFIFIENGISGRKADKRPEFQKMISLAKSDSPPFSVILVWKFSRFARNQEESIVYKSMLRKQSGVDVISITEPLIDGPFGSLIERIIEWMDEYYSINLSQEVIRGMTEKALRGGYQSAPCLGYDAVGKGDPFVINEEEYAVYEYICDQFDFQHMDPTGIARKVNEMGWRTKRGNPFEARTIKYILRNPFYIGIVEWNGQTFQGTHEVRLSEERFNERIRRMDTLYQPKQRRSISGCRHWLSGIVKCPYCGASMGFNNSKRKGTPPFFACWKYAKGLHEGSASISERKLVNAVIRNFKDICDGADFEYQNMASRADDRTELDLLKKELEKLASREHRIKMAYEAEIDSLEEYKENKKRLTQERERLLSELAQKETESIHVPNKNVVLSKIHKVYDVISDPDLDYAIKGEFIRSVVKDIVYDKKNGKLIFHFYYADDAESA